MLRWRLSSWLETRALRKNAETIRLLRAERLRLLAQNELERKLNQYLRFRLDEQAKDVRWVPAVLVWQKAEAELTDLRRKLATARRELMRVRGIYATDRTHASQ